MTQTGKNRVKYFLLFFAISFILYFPTRNAGLTFDFIKWHNTFLQGGIVEILQSVGYPNVFFHFLFYCFYSLFGTAPLGWFVVHILGNATIAYLLYFFIKKINTTYNLKLFNGAALIGALLFLTQPYSVEVVAWKACIHYIMIGILTLLILYYCLAFFSDKKKKYLYLIYLLFAISFFTFELSYSLPLLVSLSIIFFASAKNNLALIKENILKLTFPLFSLLLLFLFINKFVLGTWVGHYGEETHLQFNLIEIAATEFKYLIKYLFLWRFTPHQIKFLVFDFLSQFYVGAIILGVFISLILYYLTNLKKLSKKTQLLYFSLFGFFISLLPVSNLYVFMLQFGLNDRFGYVANIFFAILLISILQFLPSKIRMSIAVLYLAINVYFHQKLVSLWNQSDLVFKSLTDDFRWEEDQKVFMLNPPDNIKGILIYSSYETSGFKKAMEFHSGIEFNGKMIDVLLYNMTDINNGASVTQTGPAQLKVELNQWGNWWHYKGVGSSGYENEYYRATTGGKHYFLDLKEIALDGTFIYQDSLKLKEFKFDPGWQPH